jgi:hypothetical protein
MSLLTFCGRATEHVTALFRVKNYPGLTPNNETQGKVVRGHNQLRITP